MDQSPVHGFPHTRVSWLLSLAHGDEVLALARTECSVSSNDALPKRLQTIACDPQLMLLLEAPVALECCHRCFRHRWE